MKPPENEKGDLSEPDKTHPWGFKFLSLCAVYGLLSYRLLFPFIQHGTVTEKDELYLYALGWTASVICGFLLGWIILRVSRKRNPGAGLSSYLILNFLLLLFLLPFSSWNPGHPWVNATIFFAFQFASDGLARYNIVRNTGGMIPISFLYGVCVFSFTICIFFLNYPDIAFGLKSWRLSQYLFFIFILWLLLVSLRFSPDTKTNPSGTAASRLSEWFWRGAVFLGIAYLVYDPDPVIDRFSIDPYIGPLVDLVAGRTMLFDNYSQYGVFSYIILGNVFRVLPLDFHTFLFFDLVLRVLQYFLFYVIVEKLFGRGPYAFFCLLTLLLLNHFATVGYVTMYPSTGPLRFGFIYLLLALLVLRDKYPQRIMWIWLLEAAVAASAFFWSLEVCIYTFPAYISLVLFESFEWDGRLRAEWKNLSMRLGMVFLALLAVGGWIYLHCLLRTGQMPNWSPYFSIFRTYQIGMGGMLPMPASGFWWVFMGVYLLSFFATLGLKTSDGFNSKFPLNALFLSTVYGIFQFFYYVGRSHPNNLLHVSMPAILLTAYWLFYIRRFDPPSMPGILKKGAFALAVLFIAVYLPTVLPIALEKIKNQASSPRRTIHSLFSLFHGPQPDDWSKAMGQLIGKYSGDRRQVPYFVGPEGLKISLYSKKTRSYPFSEFVTIELLEPLAQWVRQYPADLKPGDYVYIWRGYIAKTNLQPGDRVTFKSGFKDYFPAMFESELLRKINQRYSIEWVEMSNGVVVGRLNCR
jgi:hypothetical protein